MARIKLKHVNSFSDRYGKLRHYFRKRGCKDVTLPGLPGSAEFMAAYAAALDNAAPIVIGAKRVTAGTVAATVGLYFGSTAFANLAEATQKSRGSILERFRAQHGDSLSRRSSASTCRRWWTPRRKGRRPRKTSSTRCGRS